MILQHLVNNLRNKAWPILCAVKQSSVTATVIQRSVTVSSKLCRKVVIKREEYFLKKDNIPAGFNIIYRAPMENYLTSIPRVTTVFGTDKMVQTAT